MGADGQVHEGGEPGRLAGAARQVARGRRVRLLGEGTEAPDPEARRPDGELPWDQLTEKEGERLAFALQGCPNARIAERLCLSCSTVKTHLGSVYRKLGVSGRHDLFLAHGRG